MSASIRWTPLIGFGCILVVFFPDLALADNCGSLSDCWQTAGAAAAAAAGVAAAAAAAAVDWLFESRADGDPDEPPAFALVGPGASLGSQILGEAATGTAVAEGAGVGAGGAGAGAAVGGGAVAGVAIAAAAAGAAAVLGTGYAVEHAAEVASRPDPDELSPPGGVPRGGGPRPYQVPGERDDYPPAFPDPSEVRPAAPPPVPAVPPEPAVPGTEPTPPTPPTLPDSPRRKDPSPFKEEEGPRKRFEIDPRFGKPAPAPPPTPPTTPAPSPADPAGPTPAEPSFPTPDPAKPKPDP